MAATSGGSVPRLILASSSRYRRALLERLGLNFATTSPDVDETPRPGEAAEPLVSRLSRAKATAVAETVSEPALVIGSDQVAVLDGRILGKPGTEARARAQLAELSGRQVRFLTGLCLLTAPAGTAEEAVVVTEVQFRRLDSAEIDDYVARERPLDCAGAFKSEALGIALFEAIRADDPTALVGLPLIALCGMLRRAGMPVLGAGSPRP
jgi:septum formation protein